MVIIVDSMVGGQVLPPLSPSSLATAFLFSKALLHPYLFLPLDPLTISFIL